MSLTEPGEDVEVVSKQQAESKLAEQLETLVYNASPSEVSDEFMRCLLTAAIKLYAAKVEDAEEEIAPFTTQEILTPTEVGVTVGSLIRAADIDLFELVAWQSLR